MIPFDYEPRTRIIFGPHRIDSLGELTRQLNGARALVVTDPGIVEAGHTQRGCDALRQAGVEFEIFDEVHENPTTHVVDRGRRVAKQFRPDLIVGLGGGSSMDCAKGINFLHTNGGRMQDYWGEDKATQPLLPMVAVPTTAGTGSETQSFALISDADTHVKMACGDKKASFRLALLDPCLTLTQPQEVTALTGIDALAHALESYVTTRRNPVSITFSREAWLLLAANLDLVLENPQDLDARAGMQLGASFSGMAIENSMLGAAHALANPLTARYGVAHGQAVGMMLPHVIRYNGVQHDDWYHNLLEITAGANGFPDPRGGADELAQFVAALVQKAGLATRLTECGVDEAELTELAATAAEQWTGKFNPRPVDESTLLQLYRQAI